MDIITINQTIVNGVTMQTYNFPAPWWVYLGLTILACWILSAIFSR